MSSNDSPPPPDGEQQQPGGASYPPPGQSGGQYPPPPGQQYGGSYPPPGQQYGGSYPPPGQQYAGYPGYGEPQKKGSGLAITALVLGVFALLLCWTIVGGIVLGLAAVVVGFLASGKAKRGEAGGRGMAITGIVTGLLGFLAAIAFILLLVVFASSDSVQNLQDCVSQAGDDQAALDQCERDFTDKFQNRN